MNLLCPNCQKMLTVAEQFAGQTMKCPNCAGTFTVPAPPPGSFSPGAPLPPMPAPSFGSSATAPPPPPPPMTGHQHAVSLSLRYEFLKFLAPLSLLLVFFLMFLPWVETGISFKENSGQFTGWQTSFGEYSNTLGLLHAIAFILTLLAGLAAAVLAVVPTSALPPGLQKLMPVVPGAVGLGAVLCFTLLIMQVIGGFGPESLAEKFFEVAKFKPNVDFVPNFAHTFWLRLAVFFEILAIFGCTLSVWLALRGRQAPPRIDFTW